MSGTMEEPNISPKRADWTLAYIVVGSIGAVALLALFTSPVANLLGDSKYAIPGALHGVSAIVYVIIATIAAYLGYRLYTGRLSSTHDLRILAGLNAFFSLVTVMFGNWIYIYYREKAGPRTYFLENDAAVHEVFFEFKEFIALFTLPLSVATAFILLREKDHILQRPRLRQAVAVMLGLQWLYLMLAFALGAAITKLRSV
jgi:hypothetical protein